MIKPITEELEKLAKEILTYSGDIGEEELSSDFWEKAQRIELDDCEFGDKVRINWNVEGYRFSDIGYLTTIPYVLEEDRPEFSGVIHIPHPENPGGIGDVEGEWITVFSAVNNPYIVSIKPIRRRG